VSPAARSAPARGPVELTPRAFVVGLVIAAVYGGLTPFVVLKLGFGPNASLTGVLFSFAALGVGRAFGRRPGDRFELNVGQTAAVAAGQVGFLCVVLAAFDLLAARPGLHFGWQPGRGETFLWLAATSVLGVLLSLRLRRHFVVDEALPFPGATVAVETITVLAADRRAGQRQARALGAGFLVAAAVAWLRDGAAKLLPEGLALGAPGMRFGLGLSPLAFASGALVGVRIAVSMGAGAIGASLLLPPWLHARGLIARVGLVEVLRWTMWPATALMIAGGMTGLALRWRAVARAFVSRGEAGGAPGDELPARAIGAGAVACTALVAVLQHRGAGVPLWLGLVAAVISWPILLVGTRVLGETNWAPVTALAHLGQALLAVMAPGNLAANMIGSAAVGASPAGGEHMMQNFRAAHLLGARPRPVVLVHLASVLVASGVVACVYPVLRARYGFGPGGLTSPLSLKWAGFAELLAAGPAALPPLVLPATALAALAGVVLTLCEQRWPRYLPSATGLGMGMLLPGMVVVPMMMGALARALWRRWAPRGEATFGVALASGLLAGEALAAVALPLIALARG
jgi:uncharacterized oligopeptide transporter (OPT) family protein